MTNIRSVSYTLPTGETKTASEIPVSFPIEGLSLEEIHVLTLLSTSVAAMTPIFVQQQNDEGLEFFRALLEFEKTLTGPADIRRMDDYITIVSAANAPWNVYRQTFGFPFTQNQIPRDMKLHEFSRILWDKYEPPVGRSLYPKDMQSGEFNILGDRTNIENSTVIRGEQGLEAVLNEVRFREELEPVIKALEKAYEITSDKALKLYIQAKIDELTTGKETDRKDSWRTWIQDNGKIGFVLGTAVETYLDGLKGVRGAAQGIVYRVNDQYQTLADNLASLLPEMEQAAPWQIKNKIDPTKLPNLKFVDVLNSSGFYCLFPNDVMAESLPDDESVVKAFGSVNLVFANVQEAVEKSGEWDYIVNEFFVQKSIEPYRHLMFGMYMTMTAGHELGHRTGTIKDDDSKKHFGENYSVLEEGRAELFSMWSLPYLVSKNIITEEQEIAGYYSMLTSLIKALQTAPQHHNGARNFMFHYFLDKGAVIETEDKKYNIDVEKMRVSATELLGLFGNIRAEGDLNQLLQLEEQYIRTDLQGEYKQRLSGMPMGRAFIFPKLSEKEGLIYPDSFRAQEKTIEHFL